MTEVVRQGFICPFCLLDLGDLARLQSHVDSAHPEERANEGGADHLAEAVVQNVRGLFDKAKRGMRKLDAKMNVDISQMNIGVSSSVADLASYASSVQEKARPPIIRPPPVRPQLGVTRSLSSLFLSHRDSSVNESAVRTNTLIIRLDRLIHECPADSTKRKEFEREVVPWSADSESSFCRSCAAKFGLTRRRHHCRLCGRVMCHQCSRFLSFLSARKLTNPALVAQMAESPASLPIPSDSPSLGGGRKLLEITQKTTDRMKILLEGAVSRMGSGLGADSAEGSLGSLLQQDASECLRVCGSCLSDLRRREEMMEQRQAPALAEQYATLEGMMAQLATLAPSYARMAASINNGETMYTLKASEDMRQKVIQKQQQVDQLSKTLSSESECASVGIKEAQLRKNVRIVAIQAIQGVVCDMMSLPSAEEYEKLVERHKEEISRQIEEARRRNQEEAVRNSGERRSMAPRARSSSPSAKLARAPRRAPDEGWTPMHTKSYNPFMEEEDMMHPLHEQRDIIKGYLSQAAEAGRLDEVEMLERNLRDLEEEMRGMGLETQ